MKPRNPSHLISIMTAALVIILTGSAFALSYDALQSLAVANGVNVALAWLWPLTIDGFLIVASLAVVRNNLLKERTRYQWVLVASFTAVSVTFNVLHAPDNLLARIIGAIPPLALVLAFELAMVQFRSEIERGTVVASLTDLEQQANDKRQEVESLAGQVDKAADKLAMLKVELVELRKEKQSLKRAGVAKNDTLQLANATRKEQAQAAINALVEFYESNPGATQAQAGEVVGRSRQWVSVKLAELDANGVIDRNGRGLVNSVQDDSEVL